ncbi:hypothetical protein D9M71_558880 [compost metagenome]
MLDCKLVIETVTQFLSRTQLRMRVELLDCHGQHQCTGATQDLQAVRLPGGDNADPGIRLDQVFAVHQYTIDPSRDGRDGQFGADAGGHLVHGQRLVVLTQ